MITRCKLKILIMHWFVTYKGCHNDFGITMSPYHNFDRIDVGMISNKVDVIMTSEYCLVEHSECVAFYGF